MSLNRRKFLASAAAVAGSSAILPIHLGAAESQADRNVMSLDEALSKVKPYLQCGDEATLRFAVDVYRRCLLGKIIPAKPPFKKPWIVGGGCYGEAEGLWDNMFLVDGLSVLPEYRQLVRGILQNIFDFQTRWDAETPDYRHGMLPCFMAPGAGKGWVKYPAYSQIAIVGWGLERVYRRTGDLELVKTYLKPLERFHDWYWRERDVVDTGLVCLGAYSGQVQHARFETFDFEADLDDMKMTPHPKRKGPGEGPWYGDICVPGNTAYLVLGERCLARLAELAGDQAMAARRRKQIQRSVAAMRAHMWDQQAGTFLAVRRDTLEKIRVPTIGSWVPLTAEVPTKEMAARMAETLAGGDWMTPLPVTTVARSDRRWSSSGMWRGDVWPPTNYQIADGLARYGYKELAAKIVDATVANAMKVGVNERYDSISGCPLGVPGLPMSFTLLTMILDGLSSRYVVKTIA